MLVGLRLSNSGFVTWSGHEDFTARILRATAVKRPLIRTIRSLSDVAPRS